MMHSFPLITDMRESLALATTLVTMVTTATMTVMAMETTTDMATIDTTMFIKHH